MRQAHTQTNTRSEKANGEIKAFEWKREYFYRKIAHHHSHGFVARKKPHVFAAVRYSKTYAVCQFILRWLYWMVVNVMWCSVCVVFFLLLQLTVDEFKWASTHKTCATNVNSKFIFNVILNFNGKSTAMY